MLKCFASETLRIIYEYQGKVCFRCRLEDNSMNAVCLNCNVAIYCNKKCMKKNQILHENICKFYVDNRTLINNFMKQLDENYKLYIDQVKRVAIRKDKDRILLPSKKI